VNLLVIEQVLAVAGEDDPTAFHYIGVVGLPTLGNDVEFVRRDSNL
jgi:hypothetical protein